MDKILILTCSTGEGHNSAARAIQTVLKKKGITCELADPVAFQSKRMERMVSALYNNTIRKKPAVFGAVYKLGDLYSSAKLPSPVYWANAHYSAALKEYILEQKFDAVICTHLYGMEAMTAIRRDGDFSIPCYGVLTDYTCIPFLDETELTGFFVPNQEAKDHLISHGTPAEDIIISGIPVDDSFRDHPEKEEARKSLEIPQDRKVFLVMTGGVGCENMEGLCDALLLSAPADALIMVLTGKNEALRNRLIEKYGALSQFKAVGFTRQVPIYMAAADVMLSKPGGLSTTEAAVANVPLVHIHAIPGCETCNAKYFSEHGMSLWAKDDEEAVIYAKALAYQKDSADRMRTQQLRLIPPDAAHVIVEKVVGE